jgi:ABC-2 type transport system permease protein
MNTLNILIDLKATIVKNSFKRLHKKSKIEFATLVFFFLLAAFGLFCFFYYSFRFFQKQEPFGPILIDEAFYLFNFALFVMFLISSGVSAYTSLFRSPEVPFLLTRPIGWAEIYFIKLTEALWYSSWSFLFIAIPFMTAYGINKSTGFILFPIFCFAFYIPFVILAALLGTLISTLTVWFLPSRRRRTLALFAVIAGTVLYFAHVQPQVIKEQGSLAGVMSGYLPHIGFAKNPLFPSSWLTQGILSLSLVSSKANLGWENGVFYLLVLISNTLFFIIPSFSVASRLYPRTFLKAQDYGEMRKAGRIARNKAMDEFFDRISKPARVSMGFLEKDIKTFLRDPAEWSQLIIFFGLLLLYFSNLKNLQFHVLKDFWKNLIFILNTVGTYVVLSSFSMRFVFPMLSLEGARAWIICVAPIRYSSLLLEKFLLGTIISMILTMPLVFLSGWMLEISLGSVILTTILGLFVCVALTGLSVGMGAIFPNFKSNNPSEIISGFGGSMLLVCHLVYLTLVGAFLVVSRDPKPIVFITMAMGSLLVGFIPLKLGSKALERMEF